MLMSCSAVLLSNYVCGLFPRQPLQLRTAASFSGGPFIDWGCLCCNFVASILAGFTYQISRMSQTRVTNNLLALKFVSSFCGSLSVFSGEVSIISVRIYLRYNMRGMPCEPLMIDAFCLQTCAAAMACWKSTFCTLEPLLAAVDGAGMYTVSL